MNDKELLELAAKAAGVEVVTPTMLEYGKWNPLTDDGDALRLAVKLKLSPEYDGDEVYVSAHSDFTASEFSESPYAATRRAIVRAAAEIGRMM